jgi:uncharacterized protein
MGERNVLGGELEPCGTDPVTGFYRDGCCNTGPDDLGSHTICAVVTAEFLEHQRGIGNDLSTPRPEYLFPGLVPGDRWCVTAANWLRAHRDGAAAFVVLASTHERALDIVPLHVLRQHAIDVPASPGSLEDLSLSDRTGWYSSRRSLSAWISDDPSCRCLLHRDEDEAVAYLTHDVGRPVCLGAADHHVSCSEGDCR